MHHGVAVLGEDALGVELHTPDRQFLVPQAHDFTLLRLGGDLQTVRQRLAFDNERMVARGDVGRGDVFEQVLAVVCHGGRFAVHHAVVHDDLTAEGMTDALVAETNAHDRQLAGEVLDDVVGQAGFARGARAGGDEDALGAVGLDLLDGHLVVPVHEHVGLQLAKVLDEVESERIVVVEDENHRRAKYNSNPVWPSADGKSKLELHIA